MVVRAEPSQPLEGQGRADWTQVVLLCDAPKNGEKLILFRWRHSGFFGAVSGLGGRLGAQAPGTLLDEI